MEITPLGDSAFTVRICDRPDHLALPRVLAALQRLEAAAIPGVIEIAPAYTTIAVFFDLLRVGEAGRSAGDASEWLAGQIRAVISSGDTDVVVAIEPRVVVIPVCYGGECGPDLDEVARHTGLSREEVIIRHSTPDYDVHCLGFSPGFPYLGGLPAELAVPRRAIPRKAVPSGSVGIGGAQTGIYPLPSPGGWHLLGRTPRRLFTVEADPPTLLSIGDRVRFQAITREEFDQWKE